MRVVGGIFKGRTLLSFDGDKIRPTSDKARESLFNILQFKTPDCVFLDLFCGTGAMGIEALSRGALKVDFNDLSRESVLLTKKNLEKIKAVDGYSITNLDAITFLKTTRTKYDVIFLDPPYGKVDEQALLTGCIDKLNADGIIVYESEKEAPCIDGLVKYDFRKYGRAILNFYREEKL